MKRVLVTGASGFIGFPSLPLLVKRGFEVHAVCRGASGRDLPGVQWHQADLLESSDAVATLVSKVRPTHLLHLAWITTPDRYWHSRENYLWVRASLQLLTSFIDQGGQRVVVAGTCAEYDPTDGLCTEAVTPLASTSAYTACKNALHLMMASLAVDAGIQAAWGRLFYVYGPHEHPARLVPALTRALLAKRPALCTSGLQERDYLYVDDAAAAFAALVDSAVLGPVNIGSGRAIPVREVIERVADLCEGRSLLRLGALTRKPGDPPLIVADIGRLTNEVAWRSVHDLDAGLKHTVAWWRAEPDRSEEP
jgi:nucleoside-diphosphate-sugar epimerase